MNFIKQLVHNIKPTFVTTTISSKPTKKGKYLVLQTMFILVYYMLATDLGMLTSKPNST
jgi:hypothetical protein